VALIHHPVMDKNGETITAAVTSLDLHDIARASKTYGVNAFYVVTPLEDQQVLVRRIIEHWVTGAGAKYNPDRQAALALIRLKPCLDDVVAELDAAAGQRPRVVVTSARMGNRDLSYDAIRKMAQDRRPILLLFGTAWGLAPEVMAAADHRLAPINGNGAYNHLAVRSAVSIILDRMMRRRRPPSDKGG
jgi:hypothetical protein